MLKNQHVAPFRKKIRLEKLTTPVGDFTYAYDGQGNLSSVTRPDQTQRLYRYEDTDDSHNLTKVTDERGESAVYEYDAQDRAVTSEAVGGRNRIQVAYESKTTRRLTDSEGNSTLYELEAAHGIGRVKSSSGSCGECPGKQGAEYDLDKRLRVSSRTDANRNVTFYTYDDRGNLLTRKEAVGTREERTVTYTWDPNHNRVTSVARASVAKPGEETVRSFKYDTKGNLTEMAETGFSGPDSLSRIVTMTYNTAGQMLTIDGPRTDVTDKVTFGYYSNDSSQGRNRGMLRKITDPLGQETLFSNYDGYGKPGKITDANSVETLLVYDSAGRMTSRTVGGYATSFEYDDAGNPRVVTLPGERKITYTYTDSGLPDRMEDNVGNYIKYVYDTRGNRTREETRDESGLLKKYSDFAFDDLGRLEKIIHPGNHSREAGYDRNNNLTRTTDPNWNETLYDHDHLDRLTGITQPGSLVTGFVYDGHDNLVSVTDPRENATEYAYDDLRRAVSAESPDSGKTVYEYDMADNLISREDARKITVQYEYDVLNRLTRIRFSDSSQDISYGYDGGEYGKGRLTSMTDPTGQTAYAMRSGISHGRHGSRTA